jgi:hypothetical protein
MLCISRITDETYCQNFGNDRNKFYIELRCNLECEANSDVCSKCSSKSDTHKVQSSRKFNHGKVTEPIQDNSHIYGGKWYMDAVKKYGTPTQEVIDFAEKFQRDARNLSEVNTVVIPVKKGRKPKVASDGQEEKPVIKKTRKPKVAPEITDETIEQPTKLSKKKKTPITPYSSLVNTTNKLVHKEVSIPTHIETKLEEIDSEGYEIEYIRLVPFEANGTTYFKDSKKNKLYKKIKEKGIGAYVGRWNPDTDMIITDIPDSDDEN